MLRSVLDPKNQLTQFAYDERDLKTQMIYPNGDYVTGWEYDQNGNMITRPTITEQATGVAGLQQFFAFDERNRPRTHAVE